VLAAAEFENEKGKKDNFIKEEKAMERNLKVLQTV
jgi:hypothetical protein